MKDRDDWQKCIRFQKFLCKYGGEKWDKKAENKVHQLTN